MKLTLCELVSPFTLLVVKGEDGAEKYRFEMTSRFTWKLTDAGGQKLLSLYQEWDKGDLEPLPPCHGTLQGVEFTAVWKWPYPPLFDFGELGWTAEGEGDLMSCKFMLIRKGGKAATLKRHWLRPGSQYQYTLDVPAPADELEALAVALCIHLMTRKKE